MTERDRPTKEEIEITPEMLRAGADACVLMGCYDEAESVAITVYEAMVRARNTHPGLHDPDT